MRSLTLCLGAGVLALSGCVSTFQSDRAVQDKIAARYLHQPINQFWLDQGMPARAMRLSDGATLYEWSAGSSSMQAPAFTDFNGSVDEVGSVMGAATTTGGSVLRMQCVLQMVADPQGRLTRFRVITDTIGGWAASRCAEVLRL